MTEKVEWFRVNREHRCSRCGAPDWCLYAPAIGRLICMRVESNKPSKSKGGGWIHPMSKEAVKVMPRKVERPIVDIDLGHLWKVWRDKTSVPEIDGLAERLGVDPEALEQLTPAWSDENRAWAFPMKDAGKKIIGIRLRADDGKKWAVRGSRAGLFIPELEAKEIMVTEGPTDAAAAITMGYFAIGRPSCIGQEEVICDFIKRHSVRSAVIVTDNDSQKNNYAGQRGAEILQQRLPVPSIILTPPAKDLRSFLVAGGNRLTLQCLMKDLVWHQPKTTPCKQLY